MKQGNQRRKGADFERSVARKLRELGDAFRTAPLQAGHSSRFADVVLDGGSESESWAFECKHMIRVPVNKLARQLRKREILVWRDNHQESMATLRLDDLVELFRERTREVSARRGEKSVPVGLRDGGGG